MSFTATPGNGRGGFAPRSGRGGWSRGFVKRPETVKPDINKHPLGELILRLQVSDLNSEPADQPLSAHIQNCQYVTSYNWVAGKDSSILVPGQPPQWTPPKVAYRLHEDNGTYYRDPNAARCPDFPIAPATQAIMSVATKEPFEADVFACGSTLANLLRFTRGIDRAFRFVVETIGDTVFFIRKENDPKELIEGIRGFGHSFPDAYTTWPADVKGSETHQRIVQYNLGGLQCLVRFECDGFFDDDDDDDDDDNADTSTPTPSLTKRADSPATEDARSRTTTSPHQTTNSKSPLTLLSAGKRIPQSAIFDLKTRSGKHNQEICMNDITPQLWLKQIPNFIVAYHDGAGLFRDIQIKDVRPLVSAFEKDNAAPIRALVVLLNKIICVAKAETTGALEVYSPGGDVLEIRRQAGGGVDALPSALYEEWVARVESGGLVIGGEDRGVGGLGGGFGDEAWGGSEDGEDKDFTACSAEDCGYCGRCTY